MAPYIIQCPFWRKFENLEFEAHENQIFSMSVSAPGKIYNFLRFFKHSPSRDNPEESNLLNVHIPVPCLSDIWELRDEYANSNNRNYLQLYPPFVFTLGRLNS